MNSFTRRDHKLDTDSNVMITEFIPTDNTTDATITITSILINESKITTMTEEDLIDNFSKVLDGHIICNDKAWAVQFNGLLMSFRTYAVNTNNCFLNKIVSVTSTTNKLSIDKPHKLLKNIKISDLGIGGLDSEIDYIFRRAFVSRVYKNDTIKKLGIEHIKGIILHGPPGTGKTLISRKLSEILNCKTLKIINGPEILDKFIGESEKKIRDLFLDAEKDKSNGLHVVIFDEIDSVCKSRGNSGTGSQVQDNIVNQLLSKMDGVEKLDNILIIGMTNRIDLIDKALLRPGRFEIKVEISLPDKEGRKKIFEIHMKKMLENNFVEEINIDKLVDATTNFSGAEITGVIKNAVSFALNRNVENMKQINENLLVFESDFIKAIDDMVPMFGKKNNLGIDKYPDLDINEFIKTKNIYHVTSFDSASIAKSISHKLESTNIELISNYDLIGLDSYAKSKKLQDIISNALICNSSVIVFIRIEEIIEYFSINNHFNIIVAQTIKTILAKEYDKDIKFVISTNYDIINDIIY